MNEDFSVECATLVRGAMALQPADGDRKVAPLQTGRWWLARMPWPDEVRQ